MQKNLKNNDFLKLIKKLLKKKTAEDITDTISSEAFSKSAKFFFINTLKLSGFVVWLLCILTDYLYFVFISSRVKKVVRKHKSRQRFKKYIKVVKEIKDAKEPIDILKAHKKIFDHM